MSVSAPTSTFHRGACRTTRNGCIWSRQCYAAASPPRMPERSPATTICASFVLSSADISTGRRTIIAIDQTQAQPDEAAVGAALAVLDRFMAALNAGDELALLETLHFPHYRLAGGRVRVWDQPGAYLGDFLARAGATGTTANGIFAESSPPDRPRCIWTYNSPAIASTI